MTRRTLPALAVILLSTALVAALAVRDIQWGRWLDANQCVEVPRKGADSRSCWECGGRRVCR
jgi:hypothetical protein